MTVKNFKPASEFPEAMKRAEQAVALAPNSWGDLMSDWDENWWWGDFAAEIEFRTSGEFDREDPDVRRFHDDIVAVLSDFNLVGPAGLGMSDNVLIDGEDWGWFIDMGVVRGWARTAPDSSVAVLTPWDA